MPLKHVHKSPASINFNINFSSIVTNEKTKITFFYVSFVELISILVNASMYFNYDFDFIFFI